MFTKQTIKDVDLDGKTILVRTDYNVPLGDGLIADDYRIKKSLPTIKYLLKHGCKVVICSHLGRPNGPGDKAYSLALIAKRLSELLDTTVGFSPDIIGDESRSKIRKLAKGQVLLLENLRFYKEEEANDASFAKSLAKGIDIFVQDGFGVVHRPHASTDAVTRYVYSVAGLLVEQEVNKITKVMADPDRPLMALIGGAKIADKMDVLRRFIDIADIVAVGGAMSSTFLLANGHSVGQSLVDRDDIPLAKEIIERARKRSKSGRFIFYIPQDAVVAKSVSEGTRTRIVDWGTHAIADIENYPKRPPHEASTVAADEKILDIGPFSGAFITGCMQLCSTVVWNGSMGVTEVEGLSHSVGPFAHGTELIMEGMLGQFGHRPTTIVGGGDTAGYIEDRKLVSHFDHVSTGGGASMELMSGKLLPGIEALRNKEQ